MVKYIYIYIYIYMKLMRKKEIRDNMGNDFQMFQNKEKEILNCLKILNNVYT